MDQGGRKKIETLSSSGYRHEDLISQVLIFLNIFGSAKTGCVAKKGLSSRTCWWSLSVTRSGGFSYIRRERNLVAEGPPPECSLESPFWATHPVFTLRIFCGIPKEERIY